MATADRKRRDNGSGMLTGPNVVAKLTAYWLRGVLSETQQKRIKAAVILPVNCLLLWYSYAFHSRSDKRLRPRQVR